jgi:hypothetical protein
MKNATELQTIREMFSEAKFPQLYSKRGFEKGRVKFIIPPDRTTLIYATDKNGNKLDIEL